MNTEQTLRIAVASFAHVHATAYVSRLAATPGVDVLTCDPDGPAPGDQGPRGAMLAAQLGVAYVDSYDEMFAWKPDAIIITTENSRHRALTERAAKEGIHVLCEKPLATDVADGEAMVDACRQAGVLLAVAYPVRFSPAFDALREHLDSGRLGKPLAFFGTNNGKIPVASRGWFVDPDLAGGGALMDHVVHCADLMDVLTGGSQAESVYAVSNSILHADKNVEVETGGLVTITYPNGVIASIDCSWSQPDTAPTWGGLTLHVSGTRGSVEIAPFAERVEGFSTDGSTHLGYATDLDTLLLLSFLDAVRTAKESREPGESVSGHRIAEPYADGLSGLRTLKVVDAARRSVISGQPVPVV